MRVITDDDDTDGQIDVVDRATLQVGAGCQPPSGGEIGFYVEGEDGEKFVTSAQIFFGIVLIRIGASPTLSPLCAFRIEYELIIFVTKPAPAALLPERSPEAVPKVQSRSPAGRKHTGAPHDGRSWRWRWRGRRIAHSQPDPCSGTE